MRSRVGDVRESQRTVLKIGTNISALMAKRRLEDASDSVSIALERLSSGMRINRASDDAAGLAMASSLQTDRRVFTQAIRNVNDGISLVSIVSDALQSLKQITIRQKELAQQAANGALTVTQRKAIHEEGEALVSEFNRIVSSVSFNSKLLLDGSTRDLTIQAGYGSTGAITLNLNDGFDRLVGTGSLNSTSTNYADGAGAVEPVIGDFNGDGIDDVIVANYTEGKISVLIGNGDGSFKARVSYVAGTLTVRAKVGDINGDGVLDVVTANYTSDNVTVLLGNSNGTFNAPTSIGFVVDGARALAVEDINGDGRDDIMAAGEADDVLRVFINNGSGSFSQVATFSPGLNMHDISLGDLNGDGHLDMAVTSRVSNTVSVLLGAGNGSFSNPINFATGTLPYNVEIADLNHDGYLDLGIPTAAGLGFNNILLGNGDGTFKAASQFQAALFNTDLAFKDINGDGYLDIVSSSFDGGTPSFGVMIANGDGTFKAYQSVLLPARSGGIVAHDFNGDGVVEFLLTDIPNAVIKLYTQTTTTTTTQPYFNLSLQDTAVEAIAVIDETMARIDSELGNLGAYESRLNSALSYLTVMRENFMAAESKILDADIAQETANLVRYQILQQAASAVLAQANQQPSLVIQLLNIS